MNIPKLCLRLAVFLCTLTIALFVTRFFLIPPRVEVRVAAPAPPPNVVAMAAHAKVKFKVQQVVLNDAHGEAHVQISVEPDPNAPAPEGLLFSLWLTSSEFSGGWSCGDAVSQPLSQSDRTRTHFKTHLASTISL
ncbi:MAG: hypothetical protein ACJ74W_11350 [Pyrinomonadaceae bacterium]